MEHFVAATTARCAAELIGVNRKTAAYYYHRLREMIYQATEDETPFCGEIEVDESYFGGRRKGKRGRGAAGKVPVFGLLKRGGKVYAKVITDTKSRTLMGIMENKIVPDSIVYTDGYHSYNAVDVSGFKHCRIDHSDTCSPTSKPTSTASRISGTRPSGTCADLTVYRKIIFLYF